MSDHTPTPWMWAWRDDEDAPASIFSMKREGHAYAVAMCPRYQTPDKWVEDAKFILSAVNNHDALLMALEHVTELLVDTWGDPMAYDPEKEVAVVSARALLAELKGAR